MRGPERKPIRTDGAPRAIGPYSQGVAAGSFVFLSGQLGLDPETGDLVEGGVEREAERAFLNLAAVLAEAGLSMDAVVQTTVYLVDLADFPVVNAVYARHFQEPFPARVTVGAAALPKGARVEIGAIALG